MLEIIKSGTFDTWLRDLRDRQARARIEVRIRRLSLENPGQHRALKGGICELKVDYGPGYKGVLHLSESNTGIAAMWRQ
jgi:putative addiction module killer protein